MILIHDAADVNFLYPAAPDRKQMYMWLGVGAVALVLMQITLPKN